MPSLPLLLLHISLLIYFGHATVNDFRIGIQVYDNGAGSQTGSERWTSWAKDGGGWSLWAGDSDYWDPDGAKIGIEGRDNPSLTDTYLQNIDFRIGIQSTDWLDCTKGCLKQNGNPDREGPIRYTPWASENNDWSEWAHTRYGGDLDGWRIGIEVVSAPGLFIDNIQIGLNIADANRNTEAGTAQYTNYLNINTNNALSWSGWAAALWNDPDQARIYLSANVWTANPTQFPTFVPTNIPTNIPTNVPTFVPTQIPTNEPSFEPTNIPSLNPTEMPTNFPSLIPTLTPTKSPSLKPTKDPTLEGIANEQSTLSAYTTENNGFETKNESGFLNGHLLVILSGLIAIVLCPCVVILVLVYCFRKRNKRYAKEVESIEQTNIETGTAVTEYTKDGETDGIELTTPQNIQSSVNMIMIEKVDSMASEDEYERDMDGMYDTYATPQGMEQVQNEACDRGF